MPPPSRLQTLRPKAPEEEHTGLLGPILRAAVGDVITITLRNNLGFPVNLEPAGVQPADGGNEAQLSPAVQPGQVATYRFLVPPSMGPSEMEPAAKLWLYRWVLGGSAGGQAVQMLVHVAGAAGC